MNTNVVISLDTRRKKKDGTYPAILRISHHGKTIPVRLGYTFKQTDWDAKNRRVKNSHKGTTSVNRLNNLFEKKRAEAIDILTKLQDTGELNSLSIKEIKEHITGTGTGKNATFFSFTESLIEDMTQAKQLGNARTYHFVLNIIKTYRKDVDFTFNELSYNFLKKWFLYQPLLHLF